MLEEERGKEEEEKKEKDDRKRGGVATAAEVLLMVRTFGAESSSDVGFGRRHVGQTQSSLIEVLVGEEVSQTHTGRLQ